MNPTKFDSYHGQNILVFEEFHSQIAIPDMLNLLDIYPIQLPARYSDRTACYTNVYIISNLPLELQYTDVQAFDIKTWNAFIRRISCIKEFKQDGRIIEHNKRSIFMKKKQQTTSASNYSLLQVFYRIRRFHENLKCNVQLQKQFL